MFKGFKTIIFNLLAAILPILEASSLTDTMNDEFTALYTAAVTGVNLYLRFKTTTPVFNRTKR